MEKVTTKTCPSCKGTGVDHYNDNDPCMECCGYGVLIIDDNRRVNVKKTLDKLLKKDKEFALAYKRYIDFKLWLSFQTKEFQEEVDIACKEYINSVTQFDDSWKK